MRDAHEPEAGVGNESGRDGAAGGDGAAASAGAGAVGFGWPAGDSTARAVRAVEQVRAGIEELLDALSGEPLATTAVLELTENLGHAVTRLRAAHTIAVGQAASSGIWALEGFATSTAWLRQSHLLDGGRARAAELTARWLEDQPATREAFTAGRISAEHVAAIRRTVAARPRRARAYKLFENDLLDVAANTDPRSTLAVLKAWADAIDASDADDESGQHTNKRSFYCSPVADGWDLRGFLPGPEGAELAGVLNAIMEQRRRESTDIALDPPATRRADALLDLARSTGLEPLTHPGGLTAPGGLVGSGGRHRARVIVTVPLGRLLDYRPGEIPAHPATIGPRLTDTPSQVPDTPSHLPCGPHLPAGPPIPADPLLAAGSWRCGNGPGEGFLAMREVLRLSCDGEVQRLVLDPDSQPLDIGRATRVVPPHLRAALEIRDRGCIMPGCQRPPSWCEAHHIQHWSAGGSTSLQNLALLCSRHHHELHNDLWSITTTPGAPPQAKRRGIPRTKPDRRGASP